LERQAAQIGQRKSRVRHHASANEAMENWGPAAQGRCGPLAQAASGEAGASTCFPATWRSSVPAPRAAAR
jgi:hypothetical protein